MVIIRRNADGTIANPEMANTTQSHPALATKRGMQALQDAGRAVPLLMSEIATKVNNAKDKPRKLKVLTDNDSVPLRQVLKGAFDPKIEWDLPEGTPPYKENDAPAGTEHTTLHQEARRLWHFVEGADQKLSKSKKGRVLHNKSQIIEFIKKDLNNDDYLMIKASNATGFNQIVKDIKGFK